MSRRLAGRTALVTGAGRGIGRAVALAFSREGANLVLCSRTRRELSAVASEAEALGAKVLAVPCDLGAAGAPGALVRRAVQRFRGIDILVNNAGVLGPRGDLAEVTDRAWDAVLRLNLSAAFRLTREALRSSMLRRGRGCVINVSSTLGRRAQGRVRRAGAGWGPYAASKFGLEGITQVWAEECRGKGIRFYSLNPLATRTRMRAQALPEEDPATLKSPESVGPAFVDLADDACRVPTGSALDLDRHTGRLLV